jgi:hypothetical protein
MNDYPKQTQSNPISKWMAITVHNLGNRSALAFKVLVLGKGNWRKEIRCDRIDAPLDLVPKSRTIQVNLPASLRGQIQAVQIDPANEIEELYECNNTVELPR